MFTETDRATAIGSRINVQDVYERRVRTVTRSAYNAETRTLTDVERNEYYAGTHIAYIGQERDGSWTLFTYDGDPIMTRIHNRLLAQAKAGKHFGPVIVA
ncbi:hypothetical protein [Streptomyces sparsogenes]|uniref:hypothetical protein n=1 Tax=Streptomyces sparsogenes TaxID=67365 RepID=UPI0033FD16BF